jgi:hypothetical protein
MNKKGILLSVISLFFMAPAYGMDHGKAFSLRRTPHNKPLSTMNRSNVRLIVPKQATNHALFHPDNKENGTITFLSNANHDFPYIVRDIFNDEELNHFTCRQFVYNAKEPIAAMNNAVEKRNAKVHLTVGAHCQNNMNLYTTTTLQRNPEDHEKITTGLTYSPSKMSPSKATQQKSTLWIGSGNTTNNTWHNDLTKDTVRHNFETGLLVKGDRELVTQSYLMTQSQSPMKPKNEKNVILNTPEKPTIYSSKHTELNKSWTQRLHNLAEDKSDNRSGLIRTMNVNDEEMIDASIEAKKSGAHVEWIVNHTALTKNGAPLLQKLNAADIPVHVFYPTNGSHACHHSKNMTIIKGNTSMHIESNGNFTDEGDRQINAALIVPNNKQVTNDATIDFNLVTKKCIPLPKALDLKQKDIAAQQEKRMHKRTLDAAAKKSATKKQRLIDST